MWVQGWAFGLLARPTTLAFHLSLIHFLITPHTHFGLSHPIVAFFFMMSMWSYHWRSTYPFVSVLLRKWTYNSPWYTSGYYRNYCFGEWNTCSKGDLSPFSLPHSMTNGYPSHHKQLPNLDGHYHCWPNSHIYGVTNIHNDSTCNDDGCSSEYMIIHWANTMWWLHSPYYWNMWVFSFSFCFIFYHLCTNHYCVSSTVFFSPLMLFFTINNKFP